MKNTMMYNILNPIALPGNYFYRCTMAVKLRVAIFLVISIFHLPQKAYSQLGAKFHDVIIKNNDLHVEMYYEKPKNTCGNKSWQLKVKYLRLPQSFQGRPFLTWKYKTIDCDDNFVENVMSIDLSGDISEGPDITGDIDWEFFAKSIEPGVYDVRLESSFSTEKTKRLSKAVVMVEPQDISGNRLINSSEEITLKVVGGTIPSNGSWVWYKGDCENGKLEYRGDTYKFRPGMSGTYYVRGEAPNMPPTKCKQVDVNVDDRSQRPDRVFFTDKVTVYCGDSKRRIQLDGGRLGLRSQWVWYEGRISPSTRFVSGRDYIEVAPASSTMYYVRAEGEGGNTDPVEIFVEVMPKPVAALSIKMDVQGGVACEGSSITLTAIPQGSLPGSQEWVWKSSSNGKEELLRGKTSTITEVLRSTTIYSVRGKNACGLSEEKSVSQQVFPKSIAPYQVGKETDKNNRKSTFTQLGGKIGYQAEWYWYESDGNGQASQIAEGSSVTLRHKAKERSIYIVGKGICNETNPVYATVPKSNKKNLYFVNFGPVTNSISTIDSTRVYDFFLSVGLGKVYLKGTIGSLSSISPSAEDYSSPEFEADDQRILNYPVNSGTYYEFTKGYYPKVNTYTIGVYGGATSKGFAFNFYGGLGYGRYDLIWGVKRYSYSNGAFIGKAAARNIKQSVSGPCAEAGILLHVGFVNIMGGTNMIIPTSGGKPYISGHLAIGLSLTN